MGERRTLRPRMTAATRDKLSQEMKGHYENGMSIQEISEKYDGLPYRTVHRLLEKAGVVFRRRGSIPGVASRRSIQVQLRSWGNRPNLIGPLSDDEEVVSRRVSAGHTNAEIAEMLGWRVSRVERCIASLLRKLNVPNRAALVTALKDFAPQCSPPRGR